MIQVIMVHILTMYTIRASNLTRVYRYMVLDGLNDTEKTKPLFLYFGGDIYYHYTLLKMHSIHLSLYNFCNSH